jgi:hypothetical protein
MRLKELHEMQEDLAWPSDSNDLPVIDWNTCTYLVAPPYHCCSYSFTYDSPRTCSQNSADPYLRFHP